MLLTATRLLFEKVVFGERTQRVQCLVYHADIRATNSVCPCTFCTAVSCSVALRPPAEHAGANALHVAME